MVAWYASKLLLRTCWYVGAGLTRMHVVMMVQGAGQTWYLDPRKRFSMGGMVSWPASLVLLFLNSIAMCYSVAVRDILQSPVQLLSFFSSSSSSSSLSPLLFGGSLIHHGCHCWCDQANQSECRGTMAAAKSFTVAGRQCIQSHTVYDNEVGGADARGVALSAVVVATSGSCCIAI